MVRGIARAVALLAAGLAVACSLVTHAYDYQVGDMPADASTPDAAPLEPPACGPCLAHLDFARIPCVADGGAGGDAMLPTYYYAVDPPLELGARADGWSDAGYAVGLDQDCAGRDGGAATCTPTMPALTPFPALPRGIDNAFATQLLAPLQAMAGASDVETEANAWIAAHRGGFVVVVDEWNGLADDGRVVVRLAALLDATTMAIGATPSESAAVVGGRIVASFGTQQVRLPLGAGSGALLNLQSFGTVATGAITQASIDDLVIAGYLVSGGQLGEHFDDHLAELVFGCAPSAAAKQAIASLEPGAFDMRDPGGTRCNRMSLGLHAARASRVTAPASDVDSRTSCAADAGADGD